ncbi:MAG: hypothetical protein ABI857_01885 [Acidobacteriota bacterium]
MKNLFLLLLQLVGAVCGIGFLLSIIGIIWGKPMSLKGAEVPNDWRAAVSFLIAASVCFAIAYLVDRKKKAGNQNKPD